jgi:hypothetical protein
MKHPLNKTWINPKVDIGSSTIAGRGMFAKENLHKGETILVWGGEYTNKKGAEKAKQDGKLVLQWDTNLFSIENRGEDLGYYLNHSCNPNVWMSDSFTVISNHLIKKGEEITIDYAMFEEEEYISKWICNCGSLHCRKNITGKDWRIRELQQNYKGHFSPLINKKIHVETAV